MIADTVASKDVAERPESLDNVVIALAYTTDRLEKVIRGNVPLEIAVHPCLPDKMTHAPRARTPMRGLSLASGGYTLLLPRRCGCRKEGVHADSGRVPPVHNQLDDRRCQQR